jgi:hypothetical protein
MWLFDLFKDSASATRTATIPSTLTFQEIDVDAVKRSRNLSQLAAQRGRQNLPSSSSDELDDVEQGIVTVIEREKNNAYNRYLDNQKAYNDRLKALGLSTRLVEIRALVMDAIAQFNSSTHDGVDQLHREREKLVDRERELRLFKERHRLDYSSRHPRSIVLNVGILLVLALIEGFLNGTFLSQGDEFGLLGGFFQAIIIAVVNIAAGLFYGSRGATQLVHRFFLRKTVGLLATIIWIVFVLYFNLAVAHYRAALTGPDPENAATKALFTLLNSPFAVNDLRSVLLMILGIAFSFIAAVKGWSMDEPYPGYGAVTRRRDYAHEEYTEHKSELMGTLEALKDSALESMAMQARQIQSRFEEYNKITERRGLLDQSFRSHLDHLESTGKALLAFYRAENIGHRQAAAPKHFDEAWRLDKPEIGTKNSPEVADPDALRDAIELFPRLTEQLLAAYNDANAQYKQVDRLELERIAGGKNPL